MFHPAHSTEGPERREVRWSEVAAAYGHTMHPAAEWGSLVGSWRSNAAEGVWASEPATGNLAPSVAARLASVLAAHTSTPERCWFGVWDGHGEPLGTIYLWHGDDKDPTARQDARARQAAREQVLIERQAAERRVLERCARFTLPNRPMWLLQGPVEAAASDEIPAILEQSANVWWPDDRAWCVGTEVDLMSTYVGGSAACIRAILAREDLEALAVSVDQRVTWDSDEINPLPPHPG